MGDNDTGRDAFDNDFDAAGEGDFAGEHDETSIDEDEQGGPERVEEEETPRGHAGMD
ncbi:hypothetical protein [Dactylosporangium sp. CA-139066]|uniref:hypothetical protein n=1 Tax=Dactylosporangium sp. CA-139066 TaxID=3239930 RepID=UPI003D94F544